jgi:hypothetical protein
MNEIDHFKYFILYSGDVAADMDHLHVKRIHLVCFSYIIIEYYSLILKTLICDRCFAPAAIHTPPSSLIFETTWATLLSRPSKTRPFHSLQIDQHKKMVRDRAPLAVAPPNEDEVDPASLLNQSAIASSGRQH